MPMRRSSLHRIRRFNPRTQSYLRAHRQSLFRLAQFDCCPLLTSCRPLQRTRSEHLHAGYRVLPRSRLSSDGANILSINELLPTVAWRATSNVCHHRCCAAEQPDCLIARASSACAALRDNTNNLAAQIVWKVTCGNAALRNVTLRCGIRSSDKLRNSRGIAGVNPRDTRRTCTIDRYVQ